MVKPIGVIDYVALREDFIRASIAKLSPSVIQELGGELALEQWRVSARFFFDQFIEYLHATGFELKHQWQSLH